MDIHEKKEEEKQGYTPNTITRKMITGLVNARQRRFLCRQNKLSKLTKPTEKELMEINCARESVKSLIGTKYIVEKPKKTNNSNWVPYHLNHNRVKKIVIKHIDSNGKKPIEVNELIKDLRKNRENYIEQQVNNNTNIQTIGESLKSYNFLERAEPYIEPFDETKVNKTGVLFNLSSHKIDDLVNLEDGTKSGIYTNINVFKTSDEIKKKLQTSIGGTLHNLMLYNPPNIKINNISTEKKIVLLSFDNDTFRAVINIEDKNLEVIKKWYSDCNLYFDIDTTTLVVPNNLINDEFNSYIYTNISMDNLKEYVNEYLPTVINNFTIKSKLNTFKSYYSDNLLIDSEKKESIDEKNKDNNDFYSIIEFEKTKQTKQTKQNFVQKKFNLSSYNINLPDNLIELNKKVKKEAESGVLPYNSDYDILKPSLGSNCFQIEENASLVNKVYDSTSYMLDINENTNNIFTIILNIDYLTTLVLENSTINDTNILESYPEYGFIYLFSIDTINESIINYIKTNFNKKVFSDMSEINLILKQANDFINYTNSCLNKENSLTKEKKQIIEYFKSNFIINNDINNRVKASILHDHIIKNKFLNIQPDKQGGFKNRLSQYLKEVGLEKKRYNDGFYYYGLVDKNKLIDNFMLGFN
jgi:hypothetical protein